MLQLFWSFGSHIDSHIFYTILGVLIHVFKPISTAKIKNLFTFFSNEKRKKSNLVRKFEVLMHT